MPFLINLLTSKLGGWLAAGLVLLLMSGAVYVQGLRIDAANGRTAKVAAQLVISETNLATAVNLNEGFKAKLDAVTEDLAQADIRVAEAQRALTTAQGKVQVKTITIIKEVERAATPSDDVPVTPTLRVALFGLRQSYGQPGQGGDRGAPGGGPSPTP